MTHLATWWLLYQFYCPLAPSLGQREILDIAEKLKIKDNSNPNGFLYSLQNY